MEGTESTGSATTGPASFSDASLTWSDASSASTPSTDATSAASASTATTEPSATESRPEGQPQHVGEPPRERWDTILANARDKAVAEWKEKYGWAEQIPRDRLEAALQFYSRFTSNDPVDVLQELVQQVQADPVHSQKLRSLAARALAHRQAQEAQTGPLPVIELADGRTVDLNALKQEWTSEVEQKFAPVVQTVEQQRRMHEQAELQRKADEFGRTTFADLKTWPGMDSKENQQKIAQAIKAMSLASDDPRDIQLAVNAVYRREILPTLSQKAQSQLLDSLQQKATASTVNPGSAVPATPRAVTSFHDPSLTW